LSFWAESKTKASAVLSVVDGEQENKKSSPAAHKNGNKKDNLFMDAMN
jgi:hypothetical protein